MTNPAYHWTPEQVDAAVAAAPRGVWLAGLSSPTIGFWPRPTAATGMPAAAPYLCRCRPGDSWACRNGRCGCSGRHLSLQPSDRPVGYGADVPSPLVGLPPGCCAIIAMLSGVTR